MRILRVALCFGAAALVGAVTLSPWLIRNGIALGNPVFPFAAETLGGAYWDAAQIENWNTEHGESAGILGRLRLGIWTDPEAAEDARLVARWRGISNPQWALLWPAGLLAVLWLVKSQRDRAIGLVLLIGMLGSIAVWLTMTHIQSRFLVPAAAAPVIAIGLIAARSGERGRLGISAIAVTHLVVALILFQHDNYKLPNVGLARGPRVFIDQPFIEQPTQFVHDEIAGEETLLLWGFASPLYFKRHAEGRVVWSSVWDRGPVFAAMESSPDNPAAWTAAALDTGADWMLVDLAEVARLDRSGYLGPWFVRERASAWLQSFGQPTKTWNDLNGNTREVLFDLRPLRAR